jgi:hypothetical protein
MIEHALGIGHPDYIARDSTRRLQRKELARLYHWKHRKLLAPLNINLRR